jgi:hypothetical protein
LISISLSTTKVKRKLGSAKKVRKGGRKKGTIQLKLPFEEKKVILYYIEWSYFQIDNVILDKVLAGSSEWGMKWIVGDIIKEGYFLFLLHGPLLPFYSLTQPKHKWVILS